MRRLVGPVDGLLLGVAVCSIASSAVLVKYAAASSVALAFWRCLGGSLILAPAGLGSRSVRASLRGHTGLILVAGTALGVHFSTWLASLERTSTAASVTLVSTAPVFVVIGNWLIGRRPGHRLISAVLIATAGAVVLGLGDLLEDRGSLDGDALALIGAMAMAVYLVTGSHLRTRLGTAGYAAPVYLVAALTMVPVAAIGDRALTGFDRTTWLAIGGMIVGPQLGGHTVLNLLLGRLDSVLVSLTLLSEPVAASALTWLFFDEVPPAWTWFGTPLVIAGLAAAITSGDRAVAGGPPGPAGPRSPATAAPPAVGRRSPPSQPGRRRPGVRHTVARRRRDRRTPG